MLKTNKILKRLMCITLACVLIVVICVNSGGKFVFAVENSELFANINSLEEAYSADCLTARGNFGEINSEIIYNQNDEPFYLLAVSDDGYVIVDRLTKVVVESGEKNPYDNYADSKKYFGGVTMYYVENEFGIFDILRNDYVNKISSFDYLQNLRGQPGIIPSTRNADFRVGTITTTKIIPNAFAYIRNKAFGNNSGSYVNTCTAVATAIVLNYLDSQYNDSIVPTMYESETLVGNVFVANNYSNADRLHKFLVDDCSLGEANFSFAVSNAIATYAESFPTVSSTGLYAEWVVNFGSQYGIDELNNNKPTMLTSTIAYEGAPSWHTMPVYGYREYSDGKKEWLVHTGWYPSLVIENVEHEPINYYMPEIWVPESTATFLYRFICN